MAKNSRSRSSSPSANGGRLARRLPPGAISVAKNSAIAANSCQVFGGAVRTSNEQFGTGIGLGLPQAGRTAGIAAGIEKNENCGSREQTDDRQKPATYVCCQD